MANSEARNMLVKYIAGFVLSLIITLIAYSLVVEEVYEGTILYVILGVLALAQMIVQLYCFLHLGDEARPRLKLFSFGFMALILLIVVIGSLWIMHHLNYNMMEMTPSEKDHYMTGQKDKGF